MKRLPHPIPYQGSKRLLAATILTHAAGRRYRRMIEPFAGSAAMTIAGAAAGIADAYVIGDSLAALAQIWQEILDNPEGLASHYEAIWSAQSSEPGHYERVRDRFNRRGGSADLLYLLARCVKNAPRFNSSGLFNQSADLRRIGMRPPTMRAQVAGASELLRGRATAIAADYQHVLADAGPPDLVYLDPPYEGTSTGTDRRYFQQLERARLIETLHALNERGVPYLLSYDGRHGDKTYGDPLPAALELTRCEIAAGRSTQATLHGRMVMTVEALYLSRAMVELKKPPMHASQGSFGTSRGRRDSNPQPTSS